VPNVLLRFALTIAAASVPLQPADVAGSASIVSAITSSFASALRVPVATVSVANVTDIATGAVVAPSRQPQPAARRRRLAPPAAAGSLGVSIAVVVDLGKTPTQSQVVAMTSMLAALAPDAPGSPLASITAAVVAATRLSGFSTAVAPASVALANSPFLVAAAAAAPAAVAADMAASGGAIGGGVAVALIAAFCGIWSWRSYSKHKTLPCCRDRAAERRKLLASTASRAVEGDLTVRTLAEQVAALKAELAAKKALEIAERNREAGAKGGASVTLSPLAEARAKAAAESAVVAAAAPPSPVVARANFAPVVAASQ